MNAIQPLTLRPSRTLAFLTAVLAAIACLAGAASTRAEDRPPTDATANPLLGDGGPGDPTGGVESSLENGSVTYWITHLKAGNRDAGQQLWEGYFRRLVGLARQKLRGAKVRTADEEDVALSAFDSFHRGAERGRFPQVNDRNDLWRLLAVITACKAIDLINLEGRQKRGGDAVLGESALLGEAGDLEAKGSLDQVLGREPTPESAAEVAEECERLLARLEDAQLRTNSAPGPPPTIASSNTSGRASSSRCGRRVCWVRLRPGHRLGLAEHGRVHDEGAPRGGKKTGKNPTDRAKKGVKRGLLVEADGVPVGLAVGGANRNDMKLAGATLEGIPVERPEGIAS